MVGISAHLLPARETTDLSLLGLASQLQSMTCLPAPLREDLLSSVVALASNPGKRGPLTLSSVCRILAYCIAEPEARSSELVPALVQTLQLHGRLLCAHAAVRDCIINSSSNMATASKYASGCDVRLPASAKQPSSTPPHLTLSDQLGLFGSICASFSASDRVVELVIESLTVRA